MPSYDNPIVITHKCNTQQDFGAGVGTAWSFKGPKGMRGRILDIGVTDISETFTNTTTAAQFLVGTGADPNAYAQLELGQAAATNTWNTQDDPDAIIEPDLPADTQIECTQVAPTGGTPAGIGYPYVVVGWFK